MPRFRRLVRLGAIVMEARREAFHVSGIEQIQIVPLDKVSQA